MGGTTSINNQLMVDSMGMGVPHTVHSSMSGDSTATELTSNVQGSPTGAGSPVPPPARAVLIAELDTDENSQAEIAGRRAAGILATPTLPGSPTGAESPVPPPARAVLIAELDADENSQAEIAGRRAAGILATPTSPGSPTGAGSPVPPPARAVLIAELDVDEISQAEMGRQCRRQRGRC